MNSDRWFNTSIMGPVSATINEWVIVFDNKEHAESTILNYTSPNSSNSFGMPMGYGQINEDKIGDETYEGNFLASNYVGSSIIFRVGNSLTFISIDYASKNWTTDPSFQSVLLSFAEMQSEKIVNS